MKFWKRIGAPALQKAPIVRAYGNLKLKPKGLTDDSRGQRATADTTSCCNERCRTDAVWLTVERNVRHGILKASLLNKNRTNTGTSTRQTYCTLR